MFTILSHCLARRSENVNKIKGTKILFEKIEEKNLKQIQILTEFHSLLLLTKFTHHLKAGAYLSIK